MKNWFHWLLGCALLVFALPGAAKLSVDAAVQRQLAEAESFAIRGEVDAAIEIYRDLLKKRVDHPDVRYNLGTLRLQQNDVGRAVLHLRTALREKPNFDDAKHNLAIALAARVDQFTPTAGNGASRFLSLEDWHLSDVWAGFYSLAFLAGLFLAIGAWLPRREMRVWGYRFCGLFSVVSVAVGVMGYRLDEFRQRDEAVVLADELPARIGPAQDAASSFMAHAGLYGAVLDREKGFVRLRLENGLDAWFPADSLALLGSLPPASD